MNSPTTQHDWPLLFKADPFLLFFFQIAIQLKDLNRTYVSSYLSPSPTRIIGQVNTCTLSSTQLQILCYHNAKWTNIPTYCYLEKMVRILTFCFLNILLLKKKKWFLNAIMILFSTFKLVSLNLLC